MGDEQNVSADVHRLSHRACRACSSRGLRLARNKRVVEEVGVENAVERWAAQAGQSRQVPRQGRQVCR